MGTEWQIQRGVDFGCPVSSTPPGVPACFSNTGKDSTAALDVKDDGTRSDVLALPQGSLAVRPKLGLEGAGRERARGGRSTEDFRLVEPRPGSCILLERVAVTGVWTEVGRSFPSVACITSSTCIFLLRIGRIGQLTFVETLAPRSPPSHCLPLVWIRLRAVRKRKATATTIADPTGLQPPDVPRSNRTILL